jgi:tetraacyldisaccharide 4'-kinase
MKLSRPLRGLLWPASVLYGFVARTRVKLYANGTFKQKRLKATVISVGNLSVGGTGKTPFVIWLAEKLLGQGKRISILTRGYRGKDGSSDEVEVMRAHLQDRVFFGVGADRYVQGHQLESKHEIDVFLLDDGFQHLQLARDFDIVLMDASLEIGEQSLLPGGRLREPLSALSRANALVLTRVGTFAPIDSAAGTNLPTFKAATELQEFRRLDDAKSAVSREDLASGPFFAFCGIGNPKAFVLDLIRWGILPVGRSFFADHHKYSERDVEAIEGTALEAGATKLITTEKDFWNLQDVKFSKLPVYIVNIELKVSDEAKLLGLVETAIRERGAART